MYALIKGSLSEVAKRNNQSIAETFMQADAIILIDNSGSMDMHDCSDRKSRYAVACEQLAQVQASLPGKVAVVEFNSSPKFCASGVASIPCGGTDVAAALKFVKAADGCGIKFILISDGEPDSEAEALAIAKTFQTKIDTVYVGPETGTGRQFLAKLAAASGGQTINQTVDGLPFLTETVTRLIAA